MFPSSLSFYPLLWLKTHVPSRDRFSFMGPETGIILEFKTRNARLRHPREQFTHSAVFRLLCCPYLHRHEVKMNSLSNETQSPGFRINVCSLASENPCVLEFSLYVPTIWQEVPYFTRARDVLHTQDLAFIKHPSPFCLKPHWCSATDKFHFT